MPLVTAREALPQPTTTSAVAPTAPAPETVVADPQKEQISPKFAAIARRERELQKMRNQIAVEKKALEVEKARYTPNSYIPKDQFSKDPWGTLQQAGVTYDQLVAQVLNQPANTPEAQAQVKIQAELAEIKAAQLKVQEDMTAREKQQYEQAINVIRQDVKAIVETDPNYETIKESGSVEAVVKLIEKTHEEDGRILSVEEAAKIVEEYLIEESIKVANYRKVREKINPPPAVTAAPTSFAAKKQSLVEKLQSQQKQNTQLKTITNSATDSPKVQLTPKERYARAIARFHGKLDS